MQETSAGGPTLILAALASHRLTRLVTTDEITRPARERIFNRWPPTDDRSRLRWTGRYMAVRRDDDQVKVRRATVLLDCVWCASVWTSALIIALIRPPRPVLSWLAVSSAAGFLGVADGALA